MGTVAAVIGMLHGRASILDTIKKQQSGNQSLGERTSSQTDSPYSSGEREVDDENRSHQVHNDGEEVPNYGSGVETPESVLDWTTGIVSFVASAVVVSLITSTPCPKHMLILDGRLSLQH